MRDFRNTCIDTICAQCNRLVGCESVWLKHLFAINEVLDAFFWAMQLRFAIFYASISIQNGL